MCKIKKNITIFPQTLLTSKRNADFIIKLVLQKRDICDDKTLNIEKNLYWRANLTPTWNIEKTLLKSKLNIKKDLKARSNNYWMALEDRL